MWSWVGGTFGIGACGVALDRVVGLASCKPADAVVSSSGCLLQESMDMASLAEETYCQLSDDVTCRASALKSLVLTSCSCDVIRLLTAVCSQLLHLQLVGCTQVIR